MLFSGAEATSAGAAVRGPLDSRWGEIVSPGQDQRGRKTKQKREHDEPHNPVRNFKKRKNLSGDLDQNPRDHDVGHGDPIDLAPSQLDEKLLHRRAAGRRARPAIGARLKKGHAWL